MTDKQAERFAVLKDKMKAKKQKADKVKSLGLNKLSKAELIEVIQSITLDEKCYDLIKR